MLRVYEDTRRKTSAEGMAKLGLDVIKIKSFSSRSKVGSETRAGRSVPGPIHSKPSLKKL